ncbi:MULTISPECIES: RNA polymerase sigma factor [unclassified Brevundimonas]|uniref:RNA polymerase sigma factor n=1 Tax=unclassified Brevundimonas TaxID=2622653 RepID=UPI003F917AB6
MISGGGHADPCASGAPACPTGHRLVVTYFEQKEALARLFRARLGPSGEIEDLMQDLYLKVAGLDSAMEVRDCRAFLYRLASNLMMDRWRSGRSSAARDGAWRLANHATGGGEDMADAPSAEAVVAGRERLAALMAALTHLPPKTQTVFRLHKFDGLSYAEVAARLEISRSSVEKHMMDALRVLSARVQR